MAKPTTTLSNILVPFAEAASINPRDATNTLNAAEEAHHCVAGVH